MRERRESEEEREVEFESGEGEILSKTTAINLVRTVSRKLMIANLGHFEVFWVDILKHSYDHRKVKF